MTEQARTQPQFLCGHCGWDSGAANRQEYVQAMEKHYGPACLALLNRLTGHQMVTLALDLQHFVHDSRLPVGLLVDELERWGMQKKEHEARGVAQKAPNGTPQA